MNFKTIANLFSLHGYIILFGILVIELIGSLIPGEILCRHAKTVLVTSFLIC